MQKIAKKMKIKKIGRIKSDNTKNIYALRFNEKTINCCKMFSKGCYFAAVANSFFVKT